jgi:hypothetical protein
MMQFAVIISWVRQVKSQAWDFRRKMRVKTADGSEFRLGNFLLRTPQTMTGMSQRKFVAILAVLYL